MDKQTLPATKFNVFSGLLKAHDAGDGIKRIKTVASSTLEDRQGDQMTLKALQSMAASAEGMTVFLNHSYKVPEDVFGIVKSTAITQRGDDFDLDFDIEIDEDNPRAIATHKSVERGVKLGTSIGAQIQPGGAWKDTTKGVTVIDDVVLLEASIVGIPANPRSFVHYAMKALEEATEEVEEAPETDKEAAAAVPVAKEVETPEPPEPEKAPEDDPPVPEGVENLPETEPEAAQEGETPAPESSADGTTKAIEPEKTPESAKEPMPASDLDTYDVGDEAKALLAMKQADFTTLLKMVETATSELVDTKKALWEAQRTVKALERERDEANANVALAKEFVNKLAELPIGRRASHAAVISDFTTKFSGIYDPDVIKMLTSGENSNG
jgi:HK97 family phage prohead protease